MNDFGSQFENSVMEMPGVQPGQTLSRVNGSYCQAISVQKPRSIKKIEEEFLAEARKSGDNFFYSWKTKKGQLIEGASVGLAMAFVRHWTNCAVELHPLHETATAYVFTATFVDIESGVSVPRQFFMPKENEIAGQYSDNRKMEMAFAIGCSKAVRNVVVNFMPSYLVELAIETAKERAGEKIDEKINAAGGDIKKVIDSAIEFFDRYDITEDRVLARFKCSTKYKLNRLDLIDIFADGKALISGQEDPLHLYPLVEVSGGSDMQQNLDKEYDEVFGKSEKPSPEMPDDRRAVTPTAKETKEEKPKKPRAKRGSRKKKPATDEPAPQSETPEESQTSPETETVPDESMAAVVKEIEEGSSPAIDGPELFIEKISKAKTIGELKEIQTEIVVSSTSDPKLFRGDYSIADLFSLIGDKAKEIKGDG